jgi:hypothetical protein
VVLVGIRRQRRQDRRIDLAGLSRKQRLVAEVHQRLVGVVVQELLDVFGQPDAIIERFGVFGLVVVKLEQKIEGEVLDILRFASLSRSVARWNL